jgi:hypothetical protein
MKKFCSTSKTMLMAVLLLLSVGTNAQQRKKVASPKTSTSFVKRPKLPIEYVQERNLGAVTDDNKSSEYANLSYSKYIMPKGAHIPSPEEWCGIFPLNGVMTFEGDDIVQDNYEVVTVGGETYTFESDYQRNDRICYALRFKDEKKDFLCAYRYKRMGRFVADSPDSGVEVQVIYLGPSFKGNLETISNENYWQKNKSKVIRRYFPIPGFRRNDGFNITDSRGKQAYYWSSQANIVLQINIEGVSSDKLAPVFLTVTRPFDNQ